MIGKRDDIKISPPQGGWDLLEFVDGYTAQIVGAMVETVDGIDWVIYYMMPHDDLCKRYKIPLEILDKGRCLEMRYPKQFIITLNDDDPTRKLKFCMLNFEGKETPATRFFMGYPHIKEVERLRERNEQLRVENAMVKEENIILKTNIPKYLKMHSEVLKELLPLAQQLGGTENVAIEGSNREGI